MCNFQEQQAQGHGISTALDSHIATQVMSAEEVASKCDGKRDSKDPKLVSSLVDFRSTERVENVKKR